MTTGLACMERGGSRLAGSPGRLIINADDWGRNRETTDRIFDCWCKRRISSTSAMMFMSDSERAAAMALEHGVDAGLHLNLSEAFTDGKAGAVLQKHHSRITHFLRNNRFSQMIYNPFLASSFEYVVEAQLEEYRRLFSRTPDRVDGHHHLHLSANVVFGKLLPEGIAVRRNFHFDKGEKSAWNRAYRGFIDSVLAKRHRMADVLFNIKPFEPAGRLQRILNIARNLVVELETHPADPAEYDLLCGEKLLAMLGEVRIADRFELPAKS